MANFNIQINKKNLIPNLFWVAKALFLAVVTYFLIVPILVKSIGNFNPFWESFLTLIIATYLMGIIELKIKGREWF